MFSEDIYDLNKLEKVCLEKYENLNCMDKKKKNITNKKIFGSIIK
jgi:hypothetical protein